MDTKDNIWAECEYIGEEDNQKKHNELKDIDNELLSKIYQKYL